MLDMGFVTEQSEILRLDHVFHYEDMTGFIVTDPKFNKLDVEYFFYVYENGKEIDKGLYTGIDAPYFVQVHVNHFDYVNIIYEK